jgi:hypothetical protein
MGADAGACDDATDREGGGEGALTRWAMGLSISCNKSSSQVRGTDTEGRTDVGALDAALVLKTSLLKYSITLIAQGEALSKRSK